MGMLLARHRKGGAETQPDPEPVKDGYDDLTDEQVAEAYATNVGGNATSRRGQVKVLRKLDQMAADNPGQ